MDFTSLLISLCASLLGSPPSRPLVERDRIEAQNSVWDSQGRVNHERFAQLGVAIERKHLLWGGVLNGMPIFAVVTADKYDSEIFDLYSATGQRIPLKALQSGRAVFLNDDHTIFYPRFCPAPRSIAKPVWRFLLPTDIEFPGLMPFFGDILTRESYGQKAQAKNLSRFLALADAYFSNRIVIDRNFPNLRANDIQEHLFADPKNGRSLKAQFFDYPAGPNGEAIRFAFDFDGSLKAYDRSEAKKLMAGLAVPMLAAGAFSTGSSEALAKQLFDRDSGDLKLGHFFGLSIADRPRGEIVVGVSGHQIVYAVIEPYYARVIAIYGAGGKKIDLDDAEAQGSVFVKERRAFTLAQGKESRFDLYTIPALLPLRPHQRDLFGSSVSGSDYDAKVLDPAEFLSLALGFHGQLSLPRCENYLAGLRLKAALAFVEN